MNSAAGVAAEICVQLGYSLKGDVGSGAFKQTFHVEDSAGTALALKIYGQAAPDERTGREIDAMRRCDSPRVAKLVSIDVCQLGGRSHLYSVEEFLPGGTLGGRLSNALPTTDEIVELGKGLIEALAETSGNRLVHRDLKPDNIMFRDASYTPVVVDFGLVRDLAAASLTASFQMVGPGTPLFASPEQLRNDKELISWRTDQFSLGIVLSYCALGIHPFQAPGESQNDAVARVARRAPMPDGTRTDLQNRFPTILKMTEPWPVRRFRTVDELAAAWKGP